VTGLPDERLAQAAAHDGALLLYDYFKHITTLSLITLGGILVIPQTTGIAVTFRDLLPSLALIAFSGAMSLYAMDLVIKARLADRALPRSVRWHQIIVGGTFGIGVGAFMGLFTRLV
jgi:hypothetical protein